MKRTIRAMYHFYFIRLDKWGPKEFVSILKDVKSTDEVFEMGLKEILKEAN